MMHSNIVSFPIILMLFFFFQAEDGIRDHCVTGVQTCALPITILHSKRANIYYLEHCRVLVNGGRVEYVTDARKRSLYWNIPIANTTSILLGAGTSITQAAMRELAKAGVLVGVFGGGGTPLFNANEVGVEGAWLTPQSEYRPPEYLQAWGQFWFDDELRLHAAKKFQALRF